MVGAGFGVDMLTAMLSILDPCVGYVVISEHLSVNSAFSIPYMKFRELGKSK